MNAEAKIEAEAVIDHLHAAIAEAWSNSTTNAGAVDRLLAIMRSDPRVYALAMQPHEVRVAQELIAQKRRGERAYVWQRPQQTPDRAASHMRANAVSLLNMPLSTGQRLGDATKADLIAEAERYRVTSAQHAAKANFYEAVAERLTGRKTVRQVLTAADLEAMKS